VYDSQWWLPPHRAAWIPAGVQHIVRCAAGAELCTAYLDPSLCHDLDCGVFSVLPVAREMLLYGVRWGPERDPEDKAPASYFATLAHLSREWVERDVGLRLPLPTSIELRRAFDYLLGHLDSWTLGEAASAAQVSERTLSRRFRDETGMTLRNFVRTARVLRAMEALSAPGASVTQVAFAVGFEDVSALSRAFAALLGERPSEFHKRMAKS
jgi:transcriptional regulator GlxA family with amidase domain